MNDKNFPTKEVTAYIDKWQKRLSLGDWNIDWNIGNEYSYTVKNQNRASVHFNITGRTANIELSPFCKNWKSSVRHEMLELLLATLSNMAAKNHDEAVVDAETHVIIRRLEKILR